MYIIVLTLITQTCLFYPIQSYYDGFFFIMQGFEEEFVSSIWLRKSMMLNCVPF